MSEPDIESLLHKLPVRVPYELQVLYSNCNGMAEGTMDQQWFELWPLERVVAHAKAKPSPPYVAFGEGFIRAHEYWFRGGAYDVAPVFIGGASHSSQSPQLVAESIEQACAFLLEDPSRLGLP